MLTEYRKLAVDVGPWAAIVLYLYAWTWKQLFSGRTAPGGGRAVSSDSMSRAGLQTAANHT